MKNLRVLIFIIIISLGISPGAVFGEVNRKVEVNNTEKAIALKNLGLFLGSSNGFELDREPTRIEAAVMLVRLLGKESEAKNENLIHPFKDVPAWASPYVAYMYKNGLTSGISSTLFGSNDLVKANQYITFLLRALGYSDKNGDFEYGHSSEFAWDMGLINKQEYEILKTKQFLRDDVAGLSYDALSSVLNGSSKRLINKLVQEGSVSKEIAEKNGISTSENFYTVEDCGEIDGLPFFNSIDVGVADAADSKYTAVGKHLKFKVSRESLIGSMRGYEKIGRAEVLGLIDKTKIKDAINKVKKNNRFYSELDYRKDNDGNCLIGSGEGNSLVFVLTDNSNKPLGYTVIRFLGFKNRDEVQDLTDRYEKIGLGDVDGIKYFDNFKILRNGGISIQVERDSMTGPMQNFKKLSIGGIRGSKLEAFLKSEFLKEEIKKDLVGEYNNYSFEDYLSSSSEPDTIMVVKFGDANGKPIGYCVLNEKIKSVYVK